MIKAQLVGVRKVVDKLFHQYMKGRPKPVLEVGYSAPYALARHEAVMLPNAKFLEEPARRLEKNMVRVIENEARRTRNLERGMWQAGEMLLEDSKGKCPVLTGQLRDSGYSRVT